jgi:hypothetical protein
MGGGDDWRLHDRERARTLNALDFNALDASSSIDASSLRPQRRSVRCTHGDVRVNPQQASVNGR